MAETSLGLKPQAMPAASPATSQEAAPNMAARLKPLRILPSLALVGVPAGLATVAIHFVIPPIVERTGVPFLYPYLIWWISFMAFCMVASLVAYRLEGNRFTWADFGRRYRLRKLHGRDWVWLAALAGSFACVFAGLAVLGPKLSALPGLRMPEAFPAELDPSNPGGLAAGEFMGAALKGQWWIAVVYFFGWVLNIFGEEFWFRGYMLPRQEAAYGRRAWILHGVVWIVEHLWQVWSLVLLAPYALLWAFIIQRGKNTWIPILVHGVGNLIPLVVIIAGVIG